QHITRAQMASMVAAGIVAATGEALPTGTPSFTDVPRSGYPHSAAIDSLAAIDVVDGRGDGSIFDPQGPVTRGQLAAFVRRSLSFIDDGEARDGSAPPRSGTDHYPDDDGSIFEADIAAISAVGIVGGYVDGTFRPNQPVFRDQAATFLARGVDHAL